MGREVGVGKGHEMIFQLLLRRRPKSQGNRSPLLAVFGRTHGLGHRMPLFDGFFEKQDLGRGLGKLFVENISGDPPAVFRTAVIHDNQIPRCFGPFAEQPLELGEFPLQEIFAMGVFVATANAVVFFVDRENKGKVARLFKRTDDGL